MTVPLDINAAKTFNFPYFKSKTFKNEELFDVRGKKVDSRLKNCKDSSSGEDWANFIHRFEIHI